MPWIVQVTFIRGFQVMKCPLGDRSDRVPMIVLPVRSVFLASRIFWLTSRDNTRAFRSEEAGEEQELPEERDGTEASLAILRKRSFPNKSIGVGESSLKVERSEMLSDKVLEASEKLGLSKETASPEDLKSTVMFLLIDEDIIIIK